MDKSQIFISSSGLSPNILSYELSISACLLYISGMSWAFHLVIATSHSDFSSLQFLMAFTICLLWWFCFFLSVDFKLGQNPFSFKSPGNCNPGCCVAAPRRRSGWYVWGDDVRAAEHQVWWTIGFFHGLLALEGIMYSLTSSSGFHLLPCCLELSPFQPDHHSSTNYLTSLAFFYLLENWFLFLFLLFFRTNQLYFTLNTKAASVWERHCIILGTRLFPFSLKHSFLPASGTWDLVLTTAHHPCQCQLCGFSLSA